MRVRTRNVRRLLLTGLVIAIATFLTLSGTGTATALWSAHQPLSSLTASAATVGVTHSIAGDLDHTYTAATPSVASAVTITNTGSREAAYSLTVDAESSTDLPSQVTARLGVVTDVAACTDSTSLSAAVGTLDTAVTLTSPAGALAAGSSVVICVQTIMADPSTRSGEQLTGTIVSSVAASSRAGWSASTAPTEFGQEVVAAAGPLFNDPWARYGIKHDGMCVGGIWGRDEIAKGYDCHDQLTEWLFKLTPFGTYNIEVAYNAHLTPQPLWVGTASGVEKAANAQAASLRWEIALRTDGRYRFVNEQSGLCATVSSQIVPNTSNPSPKLVLDHCADGRADQGFQIDLIAQATFPTISLACAPDGTDSPIMKYSWPVLAGYEQAVRYKMFIDGRFHRDHDNGYYTAIHVKKSDLAGFAPGAHGVEVYQSVHDGAWTLTGTGTVVIPAQGDILSCG